MHTDLIYEEILLYHYPEFQTDYEKKKKNNQSVISHILKNANSTMVIKIIKNKLYLFKKNFYLKLKKNSKIHRQVRIRVVVMNELIKIINIKQ